jgi:hypothetical protein
MPEGVFYNVKMCEKDSNSNSIINIMIILKQNDSNQ